MSAPTMRSRLGLLIPAALAFAILVTLGTWQIQRQAWKERLISALTDRLAAPLSAVPAPQSWATLDQGIDEYRRVKFDAIFDHGNEALVYAAASTLRPDVSGVGYWAFTPARLADGSLVFVNRGFLPEGRRDVKSRADGQIAGTVEIVGAMRWPEIRNWFSPKDDPAHNLWFARDPLAIADAKRLRPVAPFYIEQQSPMPPGGLPQPGKIAVRLRNNHLQYALTWYGLALVLVVVFGARAFNSGRQAERKDAMQHRQSPLHSL